MKLRIMQMLAKYSPIQKVYADEPTNQTTKQDDHTNSGDGNTNNNGDNQTTNNQQTTQQTNQQNNQATNQNQNDSHVKQTGNVDFEELVSTARKQERDKLYPEIEKFKNRANDHLAVIHERDATIKEKDQEIDGLKTELDQLKKDAKDGRSSEESRLKAQITTLENKLDAKDQEHQSELEKMKLDTYKQNAIASANGAIIPELVTGSTEEEVNQSIEQAKQRYQEIAGNNPANQQQNSSVPPANPNMQTSNNVFSEMSTEEISNMTPAEWAERRKQLGLK